MPPINNVPADQSRTTRFAQFLRAAVALKSKTVVEVNKYPTVIWFSQLPTGLIEVRSPVVSEDWPTEDLRWLVVSRVTEPDRPKAPEVCAAWLDGVVLDDPETQPLLNPHHITPNEGGEVVQVHPSQEAQERWERYLSAEWSRWATKARVARAVKPLYQKLFATYQEMKGRDDAYDLFIGVGLLDSRKDATLRLRRHLLAFPADILLDEKSGSLTVVPSVEFVQARPELDFLGSTDRATLQPVVQHISAELMTLGASFHDRAAIAGLVIRLIHSLDGQTAYVNEMSPQDALPGQARATFAPALIFRPKSLRSLDTLLERIERDASGTDPCVDVKDTPIPWRRMMEDAQVWGGDHVGEAGGRATGEIQRVYFPLASNEEQSKIVRYASGTVGVVVQGPPGTGKSHTIANLVSHYLATGSRVLVTAQTAQALEVLKDKIPRELQQLCVSLLGDSRRNDADLQRSVEGMLDRRLEFDSAQYDRQITNLESELTKAETDLNNLDRTLQQARLDETVTLEPVAGYRGTRAQIARLIRDERGRFAWIEDTIPHETPCPHYRWGWDRLAAYHKALDENVRRKLARICIALPFKPEDATGAVDRINNAKTDAGRNIRNGRLPSVPPGISGEELHAAENWLIDLDEVELGIAPGDRAWSGELRKALVRSNLVAWRTRLKEATKTVAVLTDELVAATVEGKIADRSRSTADARRDLARLSDHYAHGGKRRTLLFFKPRVVRETEWVEQGVLVEGRTVRTSDDVARAGRALDGWAALEAARNVWSLWPRDPAGSATQQTAALRDRAELLAALLNMADAGTGLSAGTQLWLLGKLQAGDSTADLLWAVRHRLAELTLAVARSECDELVRQLLQVIGSRDVVPAAIAIVDALKTEDSDGLAAALADLGDEQARREVHQDYLEFVTAVSATAPGLAEAIVAAEGAVPPRIAFHEFESAWRHRCAVGWLELVLSKERIEAADRAARDMRLRVQDLLGQLTAKRAWSRALPRIDDFRRASLVSWVQAVYKIPATGPSVFPRRAVARRYLSQCLEAIPAWVVSLGRLYETVDATPGLFDVAIVDEASQCWLDSLILFYIAKQVIIVGDDKQISPTIVGIAGNQIANLATAFLPDFQFRGSFTIESSLFDHAQRYVPAGVPLREHFRCVPEIIRFSNEHWYTANPLIPLRQVGKDRLDPLKIDYIPNGLRHGDINDAEARAIVEAIVRCNDDPAYEEADFGVICLQGDDQAARIQQLLLERLGPTVFNERKLRCGNPYAFQGDERNVMFLSMVAAPNANNASLTTQIYQQRFNVAMSRARDQAWLFHSIQEHELGPNCLRRKVLEFFKQPPDLTIQGSALDIPALQLAARRAHRVTELPPRPFDSWFEVDTALALVLRGYRLSAQVQVARKRIDLVVEGDDGVRLAVECDGDVWHGPERYEQDMFRQRQLERAEWRFVRVRGSFFYSNEARAIDEVIAACDELGIDPGGQRAPPSGASSPSIIRPEETGTTASVDGVSEVLADLATNPAPMPSIALIEPASSAMLGGRGTRDNVEVEVHQSLLSNEREGPYTGYAGKDYPDPRTSPIANVREAVLDIIAIDGPLPKASVYALYREGCPRVQRAGKQLKHAINSAIGTLQRMRKVVAIDEGNSRDPVEVVVRLAERPPVNVRPRGARPFEGIPFSELATVFRELSNGQRPQSSGAGSDLQRHVLERFDLRNLTQRARARLADAEARAFDEEFWRRVQGGGGLPF